MDTKKKRRVVITGLGTVNPTGNTVAESWANIKAGRCAVGPITAFDTADFKVKLAAEVKDFDPAERIDKREARKMARFTQFAVAAADEAVRDSGLALEEIDHTRFGVILSSGIGGLPTIEEEHTRGQQRGFEKVSPYFVPMSIGNMAAGQIAIRFGLQGICSCPTTACAGGTNAIGDAFHRIRDGYEDRMLCGGSESCIIITSPSRLRRATARVAAPSVCFGPWCGPRILLAAAPTAPPCFRRWRQSSPLPPQQTPPTLL